MYILFKWKATKNLLLSCAQPVAILLFKLIPTSYRQKYGNIEPVFSLGLFVVVLALLYLHVITMKPHDINTQPTNHIQFV